MSANLPSAPDEDNPDNDGVGIDGADDAADDNGTSDDINGGLDGDPDGDVVANLTRESADGGSNQSLTQNTSTGDNNTHVDEVKSAAGDSSVKEKENADHDLDKDIDMMIDRNTENGVINPDSSTTISSIQVDLTCDSRLDIDEDGDLIQSKVTTDTKRSADSKASGQSEVPDKSFSSSSDSSVVAEAVVKSVLNNAITEFSARQTDNLQDNNGAAAYSDVKVPKGDLKVGLFQYGGFAEEEGEKEESDDNDEFESLDNEESKPKELKVGLFQYSEVEDVASPEVVDLDENEDVEEEEQQADILKLYGLEGLDPVSPKSASPPESGPTSVEDSNTNLVIDVQREVYEPQTRLFSVTKSSSSAGSTPRNGLTDSGAQGDTLENTDKPDSGMQDNTDKIDELFTSTKQPDHNHESILDDSDSFDTPTASLQMETKSDDKEAREADSKPVSETDVKLPEDISPPLVQYEPVTDNGKFRIVKTVKEGGAYGPIRVGTSPNISPRDTAAQDGQNTEKQNGASAKQQSPKQNSETDSEHIDKDLIRELIARERSSDLIPTRDSGISIETVQTDQQQPSRLHKDEHSLSPNQMSLSELREPSQGKTPVKADKQSPREATLGGEGVPDPRHSEVRDSHKQDKQGRPLYDEDKGDDSKAFERKYQSMLERDSYFSKSYDKDRYTTEDPSEDSRSRIQVSSYREPNHETSDYRPREPARQQPIRTLDTEATLQYKQEPTRQQPTKSIDTEYRQEPARQQPIKPIDSGVIPVYKNLQEQQAKWSSMFRQLETEHRHELRSQYDKHQANIKRLQQQMEHELQKQHVAIRKKLDLHKEALAKMSPDRDRLSPERRYRSPDRSVSSDGHGRSHDRAHDRSHDDQSHDQRDDRSGATDMSTLQNSQNFKTWREIYQEMRAEESDMDPEQSPRLQRALDAEFASADTTADRSRSNMSRPSPRGRSRERDVSNEESVRSYRESFPSSYEEKMSRSQDRESRSNVRADRSGSPYHYTDEDRLNLSTGSGRGRRDDVSPHIQELLDNLKDSHRSLRGLEDDMIVKTGAVSASTREMSADKPRAGVYSSPMPGFKGKGTKSSEKTVRDFSSSLPVMRQGRQPSEMSSDYADTDRDRRKSADHWEHRDGDLSKDSFNIEDILSSSERLNLREKHSKHLSDLREYYEEELRELRKALSDSSMESAMPSADTTMQSTIQNTLLEAENKHLLDKCKTMEDELEELYGKIRTSEQKNRGLEKRASEYAAAFADSQAMGIQHRAHIEELQRYCRERDDLVNDLESKVRSQEDGVKLYKKSLDEEMELHRQDKIALQRITDKYESLDREYKLLQETMTTTENKLYEARTEIVDLNRAMSKFELENKRLGRENDNLRHKVTQSLNLSTMHESFGSPSSLREVTTHVSKSRPASSTQTPAVTDSYMGPSDDRLPAFAGANTAWSGTEKPKTIIKTKTGRGAGVTNGPFKSETNNVDRKERRETKGRVQRDSKEGTARKGAAYRSSNDDIQRETARSDRSDPPHKDEIPVRDLTPPRPSSSQSVAESEISDYSPLLKAERELFKLRDMMRQAVAVKQSNSPPPPKLQKKFYGSERPATKDDYVPDLGERRGRKEVPSSHNSVVKTKSTQARSDRVADKSSKKSASTRSDRGSVKSKDRSADREKDRKDRTKEEEKQGVRTPPRTKPISSVNPEVYDSPTRFDISVNEQRKGDHSSQKKGENLSQKKGDNYQQSKQRNLFESDHDSLPVREEPAGADSRIDRTKPSQTDKVTNTLDMMRNGQFTTRPEWEDVFTSMVKPKPQHQEKVKAMTTEDKVKDRLRTISEMESRYDGLQMEKRQLESSINKIPLHGRVDRNSRRQKEQLEERLDSVEKELGSLKMSLKRYNVLKTAG